LAIVSESSPPETMSCGGVWLELVDVDEQYHLYRRCVPEFPASLWRDAIIKILSSSEICPGKQTDEWKLTVEVFMKQIHLYQNPNQFAFILSLIICMIGACDRCL
jgi:hypothetical protein